MRGEVPATVLIATLLVALGAAGESAVVLRDDDGVGEAIVVVDGRSDRAEKTFVLSEAQIGTITAATLGVIGQSLLCGEPRETLRLQVNSRVLANLDPCASWSRDAVSEATFPIDPSRLRAGENLVRIEHPHATDPRGAVGFPVDTDNDRGRSYAAENHGPRVRGELLWWLVLEQIADVRTILVGDADATREAVLDFDYLDDRAQKVLVLAPGTLEGARSARLILHAASKNCAPAGPPGMQALLVDGAPVLAFDPCLIWSPSFSDEALPVPLHALHDGEVVFSLDDSGVSWADSGLRLGVDTDHDLGRSTMLGDSMIPSGELMWSLEIFRAQP